MEIIRPLPPEHPALRAVVCDFDGTFSLLRYGWEEVMRGLMLELLGDDEKIRAEIDAYIEKSTGLQTIFQMEWLARKVTSLSPEKPSDPFWYKDEYNRRLLAIVNARLKAVERGEKSSAEYLVRGSKKFLTGLAERGIPVYLTSGTDHQNVVREADILTLTGLYAEIRGAPEREKKCSKEAVLTQLLEKNGLQGQQLLVVGDGPVEIALGKERGALALGVASTNTGSGINQKKRERLIAAGADAIVGDFSETGAIFAWLGI